MLKPKILKEAQLLKKFNDIREYDMQHASLVEGIDYAAPINREVIFCTDSVNVLIYLKSIDSFLFCEQFRTGPYFNGEENPFSISCCAGMVDKDTPPEEMAKIEVFEETGIEIETTDLTFITSAYPSAGRMTEKVFIYMVELDYAPDIGFYGLAEEGEEIKTHIIPRTKTFEMLANNEFLSATTCLALNWFRANMNVK